MADDWGPFVEAEGAPYWKRHYGIGNRWAPTERGRRGCLLMLWAAFVVMTLGILVFVIAAIL